MRLFRLTAGGAEILDALERGEPLPAGPAAARLAGRLLDAGVLHPRPTRGPFSPDDVTVVIPVRDGDPSPTIAALGPAGRVIVVDDGSLHPLSAPASVEVIKRDQAGGPGLARETGLTRVMTPLVAFVDADVRPSRNWLEPLLAHFTDPRVGLVAPRVTSELTSETPDGADALRRYEAARSPLDLGPIEGRIRAGTRISYVPAAAIVARTAALRSVGGFDAAMPVGEDVDLVWRLDEAGWRCRYEPSVTVHHAPRATLAAWIGQRRAYGRSAGPLARRHPGALAPVSMSPWSAAAWTLAAVGHPGAAVGLTLGTGLALARKLREVPPPVALRLAGLGTWRAGRQLAAATTRTWWPVALAAAIVSRRARRVVLAAALVPALGDWIRTRPSLSAPHYVALRLLDDTAYGWGVWEGAAAARTIAPLLPDLTSWPRTKRHERRPPSPG